MAMDLTDFISGLPKVELHVHHVGSATPTTVARLAERHAGTTAVPPDPALLAEYFTCPTSNACTRSVPSLAEHPLPQLVAAGVPVTVNSDDPPMFSTTLNREYRVAAELLDLPEHGVAELARQAVRYSFLDDPGKAAVLAEIDNYLEVFTCRAAAAAGQIVGESR